MFSLSDVKYFAVVLLLFESSQSQEIQGRVNLGSDPSSTISESFLFNLNVISGTLPLYFDLYNVTDGSSATSDAFDEDVTVTCNIITPFTDGDSAIQFTNGDNVPLRNGDATGTVSFDITSPGRRIEVQCSGETAANPPGTTSYFSQATSTGKTGFVTIKKDPIVSLCSDQILVPNADGITTGQVTLKLSEPVNPSNVTGKCEVTGVQPGDVAWLAFEDVRVVIGENSGAMVYRITSIGGTLRVRCSAESDDAVQFQTALSMSGDIFFDLESGSVQMFPVVSIVTGDTFTPILALSDPLRTGEADVTFFCDVTSLNTTDEAQDIIDQRQCVAPGDGVPAPTASMIVKLRTDTVVTTDLMDIITNATLLPNTTSLGLTTPAPATPVPVTPVPATPVPATPVLTTPILATPVSATPIPAPANDTATWVLAQPQIVFQEGDIAKLLDVRLRNAGIGIQGGLLVRCCATPDLNTSPKYTGLSTSVVARVEVAAARSINWTSATAATDLQTETVITNPAYTEVSPCPCDLTTNGCDLNCCCDPLCTEDDVTKFSCIPGIPGGNFTKHHAYNCFNRDVYRPDYFPFLCVQMDNSPFLGLYYTARAAARDTAGYNNLKATPSDIQGTTSFEDTQQRSLDFQNAGSGGYKFGFPVQTLFETNARGFLALPEVDPNGGCSWLSPIKFQVDAASRCDVNPIQGLCVESSVLSARAYVLSTNMGYPPCPNAPSILAAYGGSLATLTTVRYHCTDDIKMYVIPSTRVDDLFPSTGESLFPEDSGGGTVPLPARCAWDDGYTLPPIPEYDAATYLCTSAILDVRYELFWRGNQIVQLDAVIIMGTVALSPTTSSTSSGEEEPTFVTPPPIEPTTAPGSTTDMITVNENNTVSTHFTTGAPGPTPQPTTLVAITAAQMTETLTTASPTTQAQTTKGQLTTDTPTTHVTDYSSIAATTTPEITTTGSPDGGTTQTNAPLPFTQRFTVTFTYLPTPLTNPTPVDPPEVAPQETRSGNPGYITSERVLSGLAIYNPLVECNATGYCATVQPPQPGDFVRIDDAEANRLRVWVPGPGSLCTQSSLTDVTFGEDHTSGCILRLGWTLLSNCTTLRQAILAELRSTVAADKIGKVGNADTSNQNNWAPIFSSGEGVVPTELPPTTIAMVTDEATTPAFINETQPSPIDLLQGLCYDVPTAVNIKILYAKAGEYGSVIQREILAAYVTYTKSTVKLNCIGADGFACHLDQTSNETAEWVQSFLVSSTVTFTVTEHQSPKRCDYDQCNEEMFFLLSLRFQGDSRIYTVAMAMFVILLTIGYFTVSKPWSFII